MEAKKRFVTPATHSVLLFAALVGCCRAQDLLINNTQDFLKFVNEVNNVINLHDRETVMLNADIDLSGYTFDPIGSSGFAYRGHFDGNGHTISGLNMVSNKSFVGLFGQTYWYGSIRNLVLDETCSVKSIYVDNNVNSYVGGIVANFNNGKEEDYFIENCVNMANVTFVGDTEVGNYSIIRIGGIIGSSSPVDVMLHITNCVNKGFISNVGSSGEPCVGGIIGFFNANPNLKQSVINKCSNYGTVQTVGLGNNIVRIGGIVGSGAENFVIEKCVNYGDVISGKVSASYVYEGGIIGFADIMSAQNPSVFIRNCENHRSVTDSATSYMAKTGGILGGCNGKNSFNPCVITNCFNDGTILNNGTQTYKNIGGIIGHSWEYNKIENCVNLGKLIGEGNMSIKSLHLAIGGIAGYGDNTTVKNCANYGKIELGGNAGIFYSGGIFGNANGKEMNSVVENCLSYGSMSQNAECETVYCGGIAGSSVSTVISNCVASGAFNLANKNSVGGIIGLGIESSVTKSYWKDTLATNGVGYNHSGSSRIEDSYNYSFTSGSTQSISTSAGDDLVSLLNTADASLGYSKWAKNVGEHTVTFSVNKKALVETDSHLVFFPSFVNYDGNTFGGWYGDNFTTKIVNPLPTEIASDTTFYGVFGALQTVTFKYGSPVVTVMSAQMKGDILRYPEYVGTKIGHTFKWCTEDESSCGPEVVPENEVTLVETYSINTYVATFKNGYDESETTTRSIQYGENIAYPSLTRPGYTLDKWDSDVTVTDSKMPASDVTFTARWTEVTEYVEITFEKRDLVEKEIEEIIRKYTDDEFVIERIVTEKTGEIRVIIKFIDKENAEKFVRKVDETGRGDISYVRSVDYQGSALHSDISPELLCSLSLLLFNL